MKKRTLVGLKSRTELIANFEYGAGTAAGSPPAALADAIPPPAPSEGGDSKKPLPADAAGVPCTNCGATDHDSAAKFCYACGTALPVAAMGEDDASGAPDDEMANATPPPPAAGDPPVADPTNKSGDVAAGAICNNPDCGHLASAHANSDAGMNTGVCGTQDCACTAMETDSPLTEPEDAQADEGTTAAGPPIDVAVPAAGEDPAATATSEANKPPEVAGGESMGPAFTIPVVIIEGQPTGDGRAIAVGALDWRVPPIPLMGLATETHDPEGWDQNDPAVICGRIDGFSRSEGENGTQLISANGFYLPNENGMYFAELNEAMGRMGVSADVAAAASEVTIGEVDAQGWPIEMTDNITEGTIMGVTVCPYPAFEGAYIVLGDGGEMPEPTPIPQTSDDAPVVPATPPAAVTAGGQLVRFSTYEECLPCDTGMEVIVASGAGPTKPPKSWFENPAFTEGDGRLVEILDKRGRREIGGKYACPLTITADGRVFGHIAPWGICHTGIGAKCVTAPPSAANYAHFKRGQHVVTAEGDTVRVGVITMDAGHAATSGIGASAAMAHYDNTALAAADVNAGEDEYGIWVAGAMKPHVTEDQIAKLRASSISGDWRNIGGQLEMVAALAVNQPGFPLAVVDHGLGQVDSMVASGASIMHRLKHPDVSDSEGDTALRAAMGPLLKESSRMSRERIAEAFSAWT